MHWHERRGVAPVKPGLRQRPTNSVPGPAVTPSQGEAHRGAEHPPMRDDSLSANALTSAVRAGQRREAVLGPDVTDQPDRVFSAPCARRPPAFSSADSGAPDSAAVNGRAPQRTRSGGPSRAGFRAWAAGIEAPSWLRRDPTTRGRVLLGIRDAPPPPSADHGGTARGRAGAIPAMADTILRTCPAARKCPILPSSRTPARAPRVPSAARIRETGGESVP